MRIRQDLFRLTTALVAVSLVLGPVIPTVARAQPAPNEAPQPGDVDPPARVGRLARVSGTVSFHAAEADHWDPAQVNWPVSSGNAFWTDQGGSAEIELPNGRVVMDSGTEFDVDTLDDHQLASTVRQGQVYLRVAGLAQGESITVQTPRGSATVSAPGRYQIAAGDTDNPTRLTVYEGAAAIGGQQVPPGQSAELTGTDNFATNLVPAPAGDPFLATAEAREQVRRPAGGAPPPAQVAQMPGGQDLGGYGTWTSSPEYGSVWYPQVAPGWAPYRTGHWAFVQPWGWTWIDDAPWGFAPFHYGRWVEVGGLWAWAPGVYGGVGVSMPLIYAPALVAFFGLGVGVGIMAGGVGWVPLGWHEPYRPWYHASPGYFRNINEAHGSNFNINNNASMRDFHNSRAATVVPAGVMTGSRPVASAARPLQAGQLAQAHPVLGRQPVQPSIATAGVTSGMARQMHLGAPAGGAGAPVRPAAPGPALHGVQARPALAPHTLASPTPAPHGAPGAPPSGAHPAGMPGTPPAQGGGRPVFGAPPTLPPPGGQRPPGAVGAGVPAPHVATPMGRPGAPTGTQPHPSGAPAPHIATPMGQPGGGQPHPASVPHPVAPAPHPQPVPQQHFAPPVQHAAPPPPVQHMAPPPVQHAAPPPAQHAAPAKREPEKP
jgi:hypothetical protein